MGYMAFLTSLPRRFGLVGARGARREFGRFHRIAVATELQLAVVLLVSGGAMLLAGLSARRLLSDEGGVGEAVARALLLPLSLVATAFVCEFVVPPWFERRQLERIGRQPDAAAEVPLHELARVNGSAIGVAWLAAMWIAQLLAPYPVSPEVFGSLGLLALLFSFAYHRIPNSRRSIKYVAFFASDAWLTTFIIWTPGVTGAAFLRERVLGLPAWWIDPAILFILLGAVRLWLRPHRPLRPGEPSTLRVIAWHRRIMRIAPGPGPAGALVFTVARMIPFVGQIFWAMRIWSKMRLSRTPVLYLRSFAHPDGASLLAEAVSPAVSRVCVMAALVHPTQLAAALNKRTHMARAPYTLGVPDDGWREWFTRQLHTALAVVVDGAVFTETTQWELERSIQVLGKDRVLVLLPRGASGVGLERCTIFGYEPGAPENLRGPIGRWIDAIVERVLAKPEAGAMSPITDMIRQERREAGGARSAWLWAGQSSPLAALCALIPPSPHVSVGSRLSARRLERVPLIGGW